MNKKILVLGEGRVAARTVSALAGDSLDVSVLRPVAKPRAASAADPDTPSLDLSDVSAIERALVGVFAVINVVPAADYAVADLCARRGVHYLDLGHGRGLAHLEGQARASGAALVSGAGLASVASALVDFLRGDFDRIHEVHLTYAVGDGVIDRREGLIPFLRAAGAAFPLREQGQWRDAYGWSRSQRIRFPAPIGLRRAFLCDSPELVLFPSHYDAGTVTYRASLPLGLFNVGLWWLARLRRGFPSANLTRFGGFLAGTARLFHAMTPPRSALGVRVVGERAGAGRERQAFLVASSGAAPALQSAPARVLLRRWLAQGGAQPGVRPCLGLVAVGDLKQELANEEIVLVLT